MKCSSNGYYKMPRQTNLAQKITKHLPENVIITCSPSLMYVTQLRQLSRLVFGGQPVQIWAEIQATLSEMLA
jgi:hypothetical protein